MRRSIACVVVLVSVLVAPPVRGQTARSEWSPTEAQPVESAGEVVLRFTTTEPGRIVYYTRDGDCNRNPWVEDPDNPNPLPPSDCGRPQARASDDYGGVRGEWIFTKAGTRTITIPIVDDDLDEADYEAFAVHASQYDDVAGQTTWAAAVIRIVDDDRTDRTGAPPAVTTIVTRPEDGPSDPSPAAGPAQAALAPVPRAAAPTALESPPDLGSESLEPLEPLEPLQPGSGFELVMERDLEPAGERDDRGAGSASWFASGLGIALVGAGVTVWVWRRTRWSTTSS